MTRIRGPAHHCRNARLTDAQRERLVSLLEQHTYKRLAARWQMGVSTLEEMASWGGRTNEATRDKLVRALEAEP